MAKSLTMADVLNDKIDEAAYEAKKPEGRTAAKKEKRYRTLSGEYVGSAEELTFKEADGGPNEGRRFVTIRFALYTQEEKYRGSTWTDVSWVRVTKQNGDPDLQFSLFQQVVRAMHSPRGATVEEVVPAIKGLYFLVWGKEYYTVKVKDLLPKHKELAGNRNSEASVRVYINEDDASANHYLNLGLKSRFAIFSIKEIPSAPADYDDDIPF